MGAYLGQQSLQVRMLLGSSSIVEPLLFALGASVT